MGLDESKSDGNYMNHMNVGGILKAAGLVDEWDVEQGGEKGRVRDSTQVFNFGHSVDGGDSF